MNTRKHTHPLFQCTHFHYCAGSCSRRRQLNWVVIIQPAGSPPSPPPLYPACPPPIALSPSRRNISNMTHSSLYLCPEYLCGHVRGQKGLHCFPHHHHPFQPQHPSPSLPPFNHQAGPESDHQTTYMPSSRTHVAANSAISVMNSLWSFILTTLLTINQAGEWL